MANQVNRLHLSAMTVSETFKTMGHSFLRGLENEYKRIKDW